MQLVKLIAQAVFREKKMQIRARVKEARTWMMMILGGLHTSSLSTHFCCRLNNSARQAPHQTRPRIGSKFNNEDLLEELIKD